MMRKKFSFALRAVVFISLVTSLILVAPGQVEADFVVCRTECYGGTWMDWTDPEVGCCVFCNHSNCTYCNVICASVPEYKG